MVYIGTHHEAVIEAYNSVITIITCGNSDEVKIEALKTLQSICSVGPVSITGCHFSVDKDYFQPNDIKKGEKDGRI